MTVTRIRDFDNGEEFQGFVKSLYDAIYHDDFMVVEDSGGDDGLDGYVKSEKNFLAIHCPEYEKKQRQQLKRKVMNDLAKAKDLNEAKRFEIKKFSFVVPRDARTWLHEFVGTEAAKLGFEGICRGETHLKRMFAQAKSLHGRYSQLLTPEILEEIRKISGQVSELAERLDKESGWGRREVMVVELPSNECDGKADEEAFQAIAMCFQDQETAVRAEGFEKARRHLKCAIWPRISRLMEAMWIERDSRGLTRHDRESIIRFWTWAGETHRASMLVDYWQDSMASIGEAESGQLHNFFWEFLSRDICSAYSFIDTALRNLVAKGKPKEPTNSLLGLAQRVAEKRDLEVPIDVLRQIIDLIKNFYFNDENEFHVIKNIKRALKLA